MNVAGKTALTSAARDIGAWLDLTIAQINNSDINVSMEALAQFEEVFKRHNEDSEVIKKIDQVNRVSQKIVPRLLTSAEELYIQSLWILHSCIGQASA